MGFLMIPSTAEIIELQMRCEDDFDWWIWLERGSGHTLFQITLP